MSQPRFDDDGQYKSLLAAAVRQGQLSLSAEANIRKWLAGREYAEFRPLLCQFLLAKDYATLEDVFWRGLPFGTAGRRGRMFPIGCNAINDRTIGESVLALANYIRHIHCRGAQAALKVGIQ